MRSVRSDIGAVVGVLILIGAVVIGILTLLGPAVGNVFSNVVTNLAVEGNYAPSVSADPEPREPVSAAEWDDEMVSLRPVGAMIVKNGEMRLLVEDTHEAIESVMGIAARYGGYVQNSEISGEGERVTAELTITVNAADFEAAFDALRDIAIEVQNERATGEEVTAEYVDLESRLRNLQATRTRLHAFLEASEDVGEALEVSDELESVEAEIEEVKGRMNYLSERAAFSTIKVHLAMPAPAEPTPTPTPTPAAWGLQPTIERSAEIQLTLARGLLEGIVWFVIVLGPYVLIGGAGAYIVRLWLRKQKPTP